MTTLDPETQRQLTDAEEVRNLLSSRGWGVIKPKLDEKILDLQNINNLDFTTEATILFDLKARKMAADLLFSWLKTDVYGLVEQAEANSQELAESNESFMDRG